ncbi:hypothetical protein [Streptomyces longisporoflavus]|uniref:Integral membrane protein n=1 Tax=Streptomyces longisporoflavus TaxID=28044 RepID=A0ABW7QQX6_9ACTN
MTSNAPNRTSSRSTGRLGGGHIAMARLCLIVGLGSVFVVAVAARLDDPAKGIVYWIQRGIVTAAVLTLLWLFIKNPRHSERPGELTLALGVSASLFLAALVTGFWPGVFAAFLTPLLVVGSWLTERLGRRG